MYDDHVPFTRHEALLDGISDRQLAGPRFRKVLTGYYLPAEVPYSPIHGIRAALMSHPEGAVASHFSVTRLLGAPVPHQPEEHVTVRDPRDRRHRHGLRCHVGRLATSDVRRVDDVLITGPERTFLDLTAHLALLDHVALGDWMVARGMTTPGQLRDYCRRCHVRRAGDAAAAAALTRARVESPRETKLRLLLTLAGLPEPAVNMDVHDDAGVFVARLDHGYRKARLGVEYDGRQHLLDAGQWEKDVARRGRLEELGWRLIVVTSQQMYRHPATVLEQVHRALRERGYGDLAPLSDDWRPHFVGG